MKYALIAIALAATAVCSVLKTDASPAATQNWVRNYVATNTVVSATSSNVVVRLSGSSASAIAVLQQGGTNAVEAASDAAVQSAAGSVNFLYDECVGF